MNEKPKSIILPTVATISLVTIAVCVIAQACRGSYTEALVVVVMGIYFLPTLIAIDREHAQVPALFVLNLLLGGTVIGWVVALVWSFVKKPS